MSAGEYEQLKCYSEIHGRAAAFPWDRLPTETAESLCRRSSPTCDLGARRSIRAARPKHYRNTTIGFSAHSVEALVGKIRIGSPELSNAMRGWCSTWLTSRLLRIFRSGQTEIVKRGRDDFITPIPTARYFYVVRVPSRCNTRRFSAWRMSRSGSRICRTCRMRHLTEMKREIRRCRSFESPSQSRQPRPLRTAARGKGTNRQI